MSLTAIDFETAHYAAYSAIAVGISKIENNAVIDTKSWLFRPPGRRIYIREDFSDIHGIRAEDLIDKPTFVDIWPEIETHIKGTTILLAHNAQFDRNVLYATADRYGIKLPTFDWVCTVAISRTVWPNLPNHKLPTVCKYLDIQLKHHDAASDAQACANIYINACKSLATKSNGSE